MPATTINITDIINNIRACFNLSKFATYDAYNLSENEPFLSLITVLTNLLRKVNKTNPDAQARMHDGNSKIP